MPRHLLCVSLDFSWAWLEVPGRTKVKSSKHRNHALRDAMLEASSMMPWGWDRTGDGRTWG